MILDLRFRRIPNRLVLSLAAGGFVTAIWRACTAAARGPAEALEPFLSCISGGFVALALLSFLCLLFPGAIGGGDIKLMAASGLYLGVSGTLRAIVLTFVSGGILILLLLALGFCRLREKIPYAPAVAFGVLASLRNPLTGLW